ncbi:TRAP transporter small permease [Actimicrobium antarcticum]|uniref:TRAP transporter small permease protein n=1 Tax=Actimicrobium antarcticum TaxID=1051899 RepID=A0ABP7SRE3_9BURK
MQYFNRWVTRASTALAVIAAGLLLAATLIITWMVVKRGIGMQNSWELELSIELMIGAIFLSSPYTLATGGHVKMDLLDAILPECIKHKLAFIAKLAGCLICLYLGWEGLRMAQHAFVTGERALGIWQPLSWPKYATIPVGMFMTALQYVTSMHRELVSAPGKVNSKDETASSKDAPYCVRCDAQHKEVAACRN